MEKDYDNEHDLANDLLNELATCVSPGTLFELALAYGEAAMEEEDHANARYARMLSSAADALARAAQINADAREATKR